MKLAPISLFDRLKKKQNTKLNLRDIQYYVQENIGQKKWCQDSDPGQASSAIYVLPSIAQLAKNLPAMQETLVQFLGWEDPLEKG